RCAILVFVSPQLAEIVALSLHDALPICFIRAKDFEELVPRRVEVTFRRAFLCAFQSLAWSGWGRAPNSSTLLLHRLSQAIITLRSEGHTPELQSLTNLVCRLLPHITQIS